jgi:hypothetical protein
MPMVGDQSRPSLETSSAVDRRLANETKDILI